MFDLSFITQWFHFFSIRNKITVNEQSCMQSGEKCLRYDVTHIIWNVCWSEKLDASEFAVIVFSIKIEYDEVSVGSELCIAFI